MGEEIAISLKNVSKCFKRYARPVDRLKELLLPGKSYAQEFWALRDINLDICKGETFGIVGQNGSGKSTLLQIIAGTLTPTTGQVLVNGRVSALLELGSGFNPEFTGRQNVFFNGRILGLSQEEIENKFDDIAAFADIGDFIDQPVKSYSSGMFVRLAFAVAVNVEPDILIVDEALAVGDMFFQHRCIRKMRALMDFGVTTLFVSHDPSTIKTLCNWAIMIHDGAIISTGSPNIIIKKYLKLATELDMDLTQIDTKLEQEPNREFPDVTQDNKSHLLPTYDKTPVDKNPGNLFRRGSGKARIEGIKLLNNLHDNVGESSIFEFNQEVVLLVRTKVYEHLESCMIGFIICDKNGNEIIGSNTYEENIKIDELQPNEELETKFKFSLPLRASSYSVTVAVAQDYETLTLDWIDNALVFQVLPPNTNKKITALVDVRMEVEVLKLNQIN